MAAGITKRQPPNWRIARQGLANDPRIFETTGYILRRQGKQEEALRNLERAVELDPRNAFILTQISISYQFLRRYPEDIAMLDRALAITPNDVAVQASRTGVDFIWKADPQPLHQLVERIRTQQPAELSEVDDNWFTCALAERDWPAAEQALAALGGAPSWGDGNITLRGHFNEGLLARAIHDETRARKAFAAARQEQKQIVQKQQDFAPAVCVLGLIDAGLGNKEAALREGKRALELLPVEKDASNGQRLIFTTPSSPPGWGRRIWPSNSLPSALPLQATLSSPAAARSSCSRFGTRSEAIRASRKSSPISRRKNESQSRLR